jgi:hypothetical protein
MAGNQRRFNGSVEGTPDLTGLVVLWLVFLGCVGLAIWAGSIPMVGISLVVGIAAVWRTVVKRRQWPGARETAD